MECNKDEAIRAKELAEKKLTEKDILGAKRLALKAQRLFPGLEGLSQFQEILDVYTSSQKRVNGEVDWYEIFGVDPLADSETIRKKYRKLALSLHPDKNKSVGADGAFKIISEAWGFLSDKAKRDAYNERRNIRVASQKARDGNPPADPGKSTSKNFTHSSSKPRNPTAQEKSQQDTEASYKEGIGKTSPNNGGKSRYNSFTNSSSSTINPATQGKPQQQPRPSYKKDRTANSPSVAGKSRFDKSTGGSSSTKCTATPVDVQQNTSNSNQKTAYQDTSAANGKSCYDAVSNGASSTRNVATAKNSRTFPSASCGVNRSKTFWTSCKACKMQYEYVHIYRNKKLLCPTCKKPFVASEMPPPRSMGKRSSTNVPCRQKQQGPIHNSFDMSSNSGRKSTGTSGYSSSKSMGMADIPSVSQSRHDGTRSESRSVKSASQPEKKFQPTNVTLKRQYEQQVDVAVNEEMLCKKRTVPVQPGFVIGSNFTKGEMPAKKRRINEKVPAVGDSGSQMGFSGRENIDIFGTTKNSCFRNLSKQQTRHMLMYEAKMSILQKMSELCTGSSGEACKDMEKEYQNANAPQELFDSRMQNLVKMDTVTNSNAEPTKSFAMTVPFPGELKESPNSAVVASSDWMSTGCLSKIVPDSDFINFDKDRTKESFVEDQVWAAYDDEGMPRIYALVQSLICSNPCKVKISWLNSRNSSELENLTWAHCRSGKTFGEFGIRKHKVDVAVDSFSHRVKYTKSDGGIIEIFPRKGDVWALYRNWNCDWNELTPDDVIQKYDMVEVLDDYDEHSGVMVVPLIKVAGFKSVFHKHLDLTKIYIIPREEMFRFSHQVPSHFLTGCGETKVPIGCRELDPAAIPEELLQVITEPEEE